MQLDRNVPGNGCGKYALIKMRSGPIHGYMSGKTIVATSAIDFGDTADSEFFVIRLKDKYAAPALEAYALSAMADDPEYAKDVLQLAQTALLHPNKKKPD